MISIILLVISLLHYIRVSNTAAVSCCDVCDCFYRSNQMYVDCSYKSIDTLPINIPTDVVYLRLNGNSITEVVPFTYKLDNLVTLYYHNNPITSVHTNAFVNTPNLTMLLLHWTYISNITENMFNSTATIETLWLNNCNIASIHVNAFNTLVNLKELTLYNNQIATLEDGLFLYNNGLKYLYIQGNKQLQTPTCCQLCGLSTERVSDMVWSNTEYDTRLQCGCSSTAVTCNTISSSCFSSCNEFAFGSASDRYHSLSTMLYACILVATTILCNNILYT